MLAATDLRRTPLTFARRFSLERIFSINSVRARERSSHRHPVYGSPSTDKPS
jgi:hypothetical protein